MDGMGSVFSEHNLIPWNSLSHLKDITFAPKLTWLEAGRWSGESPFFGKKWLTYSCKTTPSTPALFVTIPWHEDRANQAGGYESR